MNDHANVLDATRRTFADQRRTAERAIAQVDDDQIFARLHHDANSIGALMKHVGGNLHSRWRDFLDTDGEKPDRQRDEEFEPDSDSAETIRATWDRGWATLEATLDGLSDDDLARTVTIRSEPLTAIVAVQRSLAHTAQHVGQIIMLARILKGDAWKTLSIPRAGSAAFTAELERKTSPPPLA